MCRDLLAWGGATAAGVRGRERTYHSGAALYLGFLDAQSDISGHDAVILPAY